ncbi:MAG: UDP-glucose/GDP-mannose dehydrogenase family protein [Gammaproteobacteria bacterium]|nr:MAG: UDP-glucose/GDP-mannose dehydrogenase family protein [Gammaproteobacteria bacterium]
MKISVVGTGYVGLVCAVGFAEKGHDVICVDIDEDKVRMINGGRSPIHEEGLEDLLRHNIGTSLRASTDLDEAVKTTEFSVIAVGTPFDGERIDLQYIEEVSRQIGEVLRSKDSYHVVVVKSTVVPGTTDDVVTPILEQSSGKRAGDDFGVGMNPEFLREGVAVDDFMNPDRIVLGGIDERTQNLLSRAYATFSDAEIIKTSNKTAELIKYTSNSLLATMISFSNEIANLCTAVGGVDVVDVMQGVHLDKRLMPIDGDGNRVRPGFVSYLEAGCGFGGSCFPKDVKALISHGERLGQDMGLLNAVIDINEEQPFKVIELLENHFDSLNGLRVSVLGLAFKPGTDDMRESPAIKIINKLIASSSLISAFDPVAQSEAEKLFNDSDVRYAESLEDAVKDAEALLILTRWDLFNELPALLEELVKQPLVIDARRMLRSDTAERYDGIGYAI